MFLAGDLEARLLDDPHDAALWAVYADWLGSLGTPRGRLAQVQRRLAAEPDPALRSEELALLEAHPELAPQQVLEEIAHLARSGSRQRGSLRSWEMERPSLTWSWGHIFGARLTRVRDRPYRLHAGVLAGVRSITLAELAKDLLQHEAARFLSRLVVGPTGESEPDYRGVTAVLGASRLLALRELVLAEFEHPPAGPGPSQLGDLSPIWKAAPRLEHVQIRAASFTLGPLQGARVRSLSVRTAGLTARDLASVLAASWPALTSLELWLGTREDDEWELDQVFRLLTMDGMPALTDLTLRNARLSDAIVAAVLASPATARLSRLDLALGDLTNEGARQLAAAGEGRFADLRHIDVSRNFLDSHHVARIRDAFPRAEVLGATQDNPVVYRPTPPF